jgi:hypothetical protein
MLNRGVDAVLEAGPRFRCSEAESWAWEELNLRLHPETKIARVPTGSAAPRRAELGRATRFSSLVAATSHAGLIRKFTVGGHAAVSGRSPDPISVAPVAR